MYFVHSPVISLPSIQLWQNHHADSLQAPSESGFVLVVSRTASYVIQPFDQEVGLLPFTRCSSRNARIKTVYEPLEPTPGTAGQTRGEGGHGTMPER